MPIATSAVEAEEESNEEEIFNDLDELTYFTNTRQSERVSRPPERFDEMLMTQCLMSQADDPLTLHEKL